MILSPIFGVKTYSLRKLEVSKTGTGTQFSVVENLVKFLLGRRQVEGKT